MADLNKQYDSAYALVAAIPKTETHLGYDIHASAEDSDYSEAGQGSFVPFAVIEEALEYGSRAGLTLAQDVVTIVEEKGIELVRVGTYALIGNEFVKILDIDEDGATMTLSRGVLDTVPTPHPAGSTILFVDGRWGFLQDQYATDETIYVKVPTRNTNGVQTLDSARTLRVKMSGRQNLPYPLAKVSIDNQYVYPVFLGNMDLSWNYRNRLTQTAYIVEQSESTITPEDGGVYTFKDGSTGAYPYYHGTSINSTYRIRIYDVDTDKLLSSVEGTGPSRSYSYPYTQELLDNPTGLFCRGFRVKLDAVRTEQVGATTVKYYSLQNWDFESLRIGFGFYWDGYWGGRRYLNDAMVFAGVEEFRIIGDLYQGWGGRWDESWSGPVTYQAGTYTKYAYGDDWSGWSGVWGNSWGTAVDVNSGGIPTRYTY